MNPLIAVLVALCLGIGFWVDSEVLSLFWAVWWLPLIAAYLMVCQGKAFKATPRAWQLTITLGVGTACLLAIFLFDDTLTLFVCGSMLLFACLLVHHLSKQVPGSFYRLLAILIAVSFIWLPVSINRVVVKLPNLSAGTYLTLLESASDAAPLDAQFFNLFDDHLELNVDLGSQIYFQQAHAAPRLKIDIQRPHIVVRLISISYETRLLFLDIPLLQIEGGQLNTLISKDVVANANTDVRLSMDGDRLLVDQLIPEKETVLQLPHMPDHVFSIADHLKLIVVRLVAWLTLCFMLLVWVPRGGPAGDEDAIHV